MPKNTPATPFTTKETIDEVLRQCAGVNPAHHLWINTSSIWALNIVLVHPKDNRVQRVRRSLKTRDFEEARTACDALLREYAANPEVHLSIRPHHTTRKSARVQVAVVAPVARPGRPRRPRGDQAPATSGEATPLAA